MNGSGLKTLAWVSAVYDLLLAVPMLFAAPQTAVLFGAPPPVPVVNAQLNGVFTLSLAVGYLWAARAPEARRGYFWIAGVLAKGLGVILFLADHVLRGSPASFLLFAVTDGTLALDAGAVAAARPLASTRGAPRACGTRRERSARPPADRCRTSSRAP